MTAIDLESRRRAAEGAEWQPACNDNAGRLPWRQAALFIVGLALGAWSALALLLQAACAHWPF